MVVLPAPFGPSRPVIAPSRASNDDVLHGGHRAESFSQSRGRDHRSAAAAGAGSGPAGVRKNGGRRTRADAADVEAVGAAALDELTDQARCRTVVPMTPWPVAGTVTWRARVEMLRDRLAPARRRHRVDLAGQHERRHVGRHRRVVALGHRGAGPERAGFERPSSEVQAERRAGAFRGARRPGSRATRPRCRAPRAACRRSCGRRFRPASASAKRP